MCRIAERMNSCFPHSPPPLTSHLWANHVTRLGFHPGDQRGCCPHLQATWLPRHGSGSLCARGSLCSLRHVALPFGAPLNPPKMGHVDAPWRGPLRAAAGNSCEGAVLGGPPCHPTDACPPPASGVAGGLTNLSKMPACNIMLLGAQRKTLSGFSSTSVLPHTGYIYHSDIVQSLPPVSAP